MRTGYRSRSLVLRWSSTAHEADSGRTYDNGMTREEILKDIKIVITLQKVGDRSLSLRLCIMKILNDLVDDNYDDDITF